MAKARKQNLCKKMQQCVGDLITDLARDRKSSTTLPEMIHRLRVTCRQGEALLRWCKQSANQPLRTLKKNFRRIRHQAGPLRDADIILMQLQAFSPRRLTHHWALLWGMGVQQRNEVAKAWREVHAKLLHDTSQTDHIITQACAKETIVTHSQKRCFANLQDIYDRWLDAAQQGQDPIRLHLVRIAGKQLRYALETYPGKKLPTQKKWTSWLKDVQDALGQLRDRQLFKTWIHRLENTEPVTSIVKAAAWLAFLRTCQNAASKQIQIQERQVHQLLKKQPEWTLDRS